MTMTMQGEELISAPIEAVWEALNDPDILKACIPGCEAIQKQSDTQMSATVAIKIGAITARFSGNVELKNLQPPHGYTIHGEGKGGLAGFAKGTAEVSLLPDTDDRTILKYSVEANIGGRIAQLGSRLMLSTAKKLSAQFFAKLGEIVGRSTPAAAAH